MSLNAAALAFFDEQPHLAVLLDAGAHIVRISAKLRHLAKLPDDGGGAVPFLDLVDEQARESVVSALLDIREPGQTTSVSFRLSHANGASPILYWTLSRSADGSTIFAVASVNDPGRLVGSEFGTKIDILQHVIDNTPVVLWAVDEKGIFTLSDGAALAALGLKPGQVVGLDSFQVYAADKPIVHAIQGALAGGFSAQVVPGGGRMWESRYIPLTREDGSVEGVIGFSLDVTEREQAENELRQKVALVEQQESAIQSLSTPIVRVWAGVLALPLVGILDSVRIERILSTLLEAVVHDQAEYVILDMTGIANVDDTTADYVFRVLRALSLLGTQAIVTGIQPGVAQALVEIGLDLGNVMTLGDLEEAIRFVMKKRNATTKPAARSGKSSGKNGR